jgi:hypothetical protein
VAEKELTEEQFTWLIVDEFKHYLFRKLNKVVHRFIALQFALLIVDELKLHLFASHPAHSE